MKNLLLLLSALLMPLFTFARDAQEAGIDQKIDDIVGVGTEWFVNLIFYAIPFSENIQIPWVLIVLVGAALFFTLYFKLINLTGFFTAIGVVRGKYDDLEEHDETPAVSEGSVHTVDGDNPDTIRVEKSDSVEGEGEVSHFQALTAALSATVGLGNIAGVAVALSIGGAGATFWMIVAGLIGMASKFVECTLGVKYREVDSEGTIYGGPMYYLKKGLSFKGMAGLGKVLAILFAIMCIGGSFGGGNMFQANQAFKMVSYVSQSEIGEATIEEFKGSTIFIKEDSSDFDLDTTDSDASTLSFNNSEIGPAVLTLPKANYLADSAKPKYLVKGEYRYDTTINEQVVLYCAIDDSTEKTLTMPMTTLSKMGKTTPLEGKGWIFGLIMAIFVGVVIIGGIKKIAKVTDKIVPFMVAIYVLASITILVLYADKIGWAFGEIFDGAFGTASIAGGFIGVLIQGFKRAAFSNEAGVGSASIAHSAVKTKNPASEGLVALLEPFIDTVVVCTMTALVIIITGNLDVGATLSFEDGVILTSTAFESAFPWFRWVLTAAVVLFAFSTMISWSYYGFQAWSFLFGRGKKAEYLYKFIFCLFVVVGSAASLGAVIDFSDAMIFAMLVPNMIGLLILAPEVKKELRKYKAKIKSLKEAKAKS